jgi:iron complex outermembrane recepter protein
MKTSTFASRARFSASVAPVVLGLALISAPAFAQTAPQAAEEEAAADEIVVTGSLITNPNLVQSAPVNVTTADTIALRQNNVAEEVLRDIPGIVPNIGSAVNNGNGGASFVDLRGLGSFRNIVLLDGNRIAPSGLVGRVDLNNIPVALVERVDALTGGAATTYGADAVSGVVNFITKKDFAGMELSVGEKITEKGDGNYFRSDLTLGANFDDGRGNATLSMGYQSSDAVYQGARAISAFNTDSYSGTVGGGSGTSVPSRFSGTRPLTAGVPNTISPFVQTGVTAADFTRPDGTVVKAGTPILAPVAGGVANGGVRQVNAAGQAVGTFQTFNFNPYNVFQTPFERFNIFAQARYEVADGIEVYTRALFSKNHVNTIIAPSGSFGGAVDIPLSNPYLPVALRNQLCAFNIAPTVTGVNAAGASVSGQATYVPRFTPAQCAAAALATSPSDPNFRSVNVTLSRRAVEVGPRISDFQTTIFDYRAGVRGDITDSIHFDVNGSYGESENVQSQQNYTLQSRIRTAVFATNTTTCLAGATGGASPTAGTGCVPVNIFGAANSITPAMVPYLTATATTTVRTSLAQVRGVVNGDFGLTIPSASDPINFAVGGEYRKYAADQLSDTLSQTAGELGGAGGAAPEIHGGYDVYEAFGELNIPLVSDKPFFHNLSAEAGVRYSSYSVKAAGNPSYKTTTYKGGLTWAPTEDVKFRGGYAHAVRAPNISELFTPQTVGLTNLGTDPCANAAPTLNANLRAVCLAQGAPAGTIGSILNGTAGQINAVFGGNLGLKPETSNSYTFGTVLTPSFVPGLSLTVDYYNIKVSKAITNPTPGDLILACFGATPSAPSASAATDPNCTRIRRNPITGGLDGDPATTRGLLSPLSNLGALATDGIDIALNYKRDIGFADLTFSTVGNYTFNSKFKANASDPTALNRECTGYYSVNCASIQPKFQWTSRATLGFDNIDVSFQWRHLDKVKFEPQQLADDLAAAISGGCTGIASAADINSADPDGCLVEPAFRQIKAADYFDLSVRFSVGDHLEIVASANNVLNKKPPLVGATVGVTTYNSGNTYPSTYDALGRSYAVSAKIKF